MTLSQLVNNGLLNEIGQISLNDEMYSHSYYIEENDTRTLNLNNEDLRELKIALDDGRVFTFPLNQEIEINGLDVIARNIRNTSFVLSFEKTVSVDPSQFQDAPNP
jgi:hypothetical protein